MNQKQSIEEILQKVINQYRLYNYTDNQVFFRDYTMDIHSSTDLFSFIRGHKRGEKKALVIAGAIGSGKSTFLHNYLNVLNDRNQIILSPDLYMNSFYPNMDYLDAYYKTRKIIKQCYSECIRLKVSFIVEMVPAKKDKIQLIQQLKANDYMIACCFLITDDVEINNTRICERVKSGSFMVPYEKVLNRYEETNDARELIENLVDYYYLIDASESRIRLLDNNWCLGKGDGCG